MFAYLFRYCLHGAVVLFQKISFMKASIAIQRDENSWYTEMANDIRLYILSGG